MMCDFFCGSPTVRCITETSAPVATGSNLDAAQRFYRLDYYICAIYELSLDPPRRPSPCFFRIPQQHCTCKYNSSHDKKAVFTQNFPTRVTDTCKIYCNIVQLTVAFVKNDWSRWATLTAFRKTPQQIGTRPPPPRHALHLTLSPPPRSK